MKRLLPFLILALGAVPSATAGSASFGGVIVAKDPARKAVATASANGVVRTVRAPGAFARLHVGQRVGFHARRLADGTFAASRVSVTSRSTHALLRGVVVRYERARARYLVSAGGTVVALRAHAGRALASSAHDRSARPGDQIVAAVTITGSTLQAGQVAQVGRVGTLEIEGIVTEISPTSLKLVVAHAGVVTVAIPAGMQLKNVKLFDEVELRVAVGTDGSFTLLAARAEQNQAGNQNADEDEEDDEDDDDDDDDGGDDDD
jgi:hypothetical protein